MKLLTATITALTLSSCATIPKGYEGARWECSFSQECVDDYVAEVNALAKLPTQDLILYFQQQQRKADAYRSIGNSFGALSNSIVHEPKYLPQPAPAPQINIIMPAQKNPYWSK